MKINQMIKDFKIITKNEGGIAIMLVITAIVLLSMIMISFSFDSNINKIKVFNIEDRGQAKLTAESGLQFAMARLRLYKEAFNYLQKNEAAKDFATPDVINSIWNFPFVFPIPVSSTMNQIQKDSIEKFLDKENNYLEGTLKLTINNIANKINLNMIRASLLAAAEESEKDETNEEKEEDKEFNTENQIIKSLKYSVEKKSESDDVFQGKYYGFDPIMLVNILKLNISDPQSLQDSGGALGEFDRINITPKKAPFASFSEIYSLPGWDDELVELIKNEFTVHGAIMIDLNKITDKMLRLLIPRINDEEVKEFFEYKDDPEDPKTFNTKEDFKKYIVQIGNILSSEDFDERMTKFENQGLKFGPTPSLFKVISVGGKGRANYTITAYISIPAQPLVKATPPKTENPDQKEINENKTEEELEEERKAEEAKKAEAAKKQKTQLLEPRIIEIFIN